ncbi:hypothetical protein M126_3559 [Bacteroides fragilis str. S6L3]|uniref:Uncharacterized protein n=1 Tax=Bacteroides fragilis str. S36L11 TaxID=1339327 RepID=A0A015X7P3_BACFG|nr:hypothetical protein M136_3219 [Bacteroides fragilis str. S36L11]EYA03536.1 hypothetical protein M126_3559 [Bacteroides fragilis str. S6L3]EYB03989.1 hypothetical protein M129_3404 [Bacteroides fragilis str. S6R5]EYE45626.1 hypothetical protein M127_3306 [Bacteroides fragilis str. S6L5]EYE51408.1 hypothetical protein M131_3294 [Bacteroides fragilis str. S6R8]
MVLWRTPLVRFKVINSLFSHILRAQRYKTKKLKTVFRFVYFILLTKY